jgi:hypothetical protein
VAFRAIQYAERWKVTPIRVAAGQPLSVTLKEIESKTGLPLVLGGANGERKPADVVLGKDFEGPIWKLLEDLANETDCTLAPAALKASPVEFLKSRRNAFCEPQVVGGNRFSIEMLGSFGRQEHVQMGFRVFSDPRLKVWGFTPSIERAVTDSGEVLQPANPASTQRFPLPSEKARSIDGTTAVRAPTRPAKRMDVEVVFTLIMLLESERAEVKDLKHLKRFDVGNLPVLYSGMKVESEKLLCIELDFPAGSPLGVPKVTLRDAKGITVEAHSLNPTIDQIGTPGYRAYFFYDKIGPPESFEIELHTRGSAKDIRVKFKDVPLP